MKRVGAGGGGRAGGGVSVAFELAAILRPRSRPGSTSVPRPLDRAGAVAADQAEQAVDGAHAGPGQRVVEQPFGVVPDVLAVRGEDRDHAARSRSA